MPEPQPEFSCRHCLRKFGSRNAVSAHLRFCEIWKIVREARRQESAEPQADVPRQEEPVEKIPRDVARGHGASIQNREVRRSRRPSHESLVTLLKADEDFMWLNEECQDHARHALLLGPLQSFRSTSEEWTWVQSALQRCHHDILQLIFVWQLDHGALFQAYRSMLAIRKQWLIYRYKDFDSANIAPDGPYNDGNAALNTAHVAIQPEEAKLNEVIERLRWLAVVSS